MTDTYFDYQIIILAIFKVKIRGFEVYTYNTWQRNWMSLDLIGSFGIDQNKTFEDIIKGSMKWIKAHFIDKWITKINQKNHALVLFLILSSFAFPHFPISGLLLFQLFKAHFNDYKDNKDVTRRHMDIICEASGAELKEWDTKKKTNIITETLLAFCTEEITICVNSGHHWTTVPTRSCYSLS